MPVTGTCQASANGRSGKHTAARPRAPARASVPGPRTRTEQTRPGSPNLRAESPEEMAIFSNSKEMLATCSHLRLLSRAWQRVSHVPSEVTK